MPHALALLLAVASYSADFDILIRNGRLVDSANNPWRYADVGIQGDTVQAIGNLNGRTAARHRCARPGGGRSS